MRYRLPKKITHANQHKLSWRRKFELTAYFVVVMSIVVLAANLMIITKTEALTIESEGTTYQTTAISEPEVMPIEEVKISCSDSIDNFLNSYPNTPLRGMGKQVVSAVKSVSGKEDCEAAKWFIAIACTESSCARNHRNYNFVGLKGYNCRKVKCDKQGFEVFDSLEHSINISVKRLYKPYLSKKTMDAYRGKYCQSACTYWETNVNNFLSKM